MAQHDPNEDLAAQIAQSEVEAKSETKWDFYTGIVLILLPIPIMVVSAIVKGNVWGLHPVLLFAMVVYGIVLIQKNRNTQASDNA